MIGWVFRLDEIPVPSSRSWNKQPKPCSSILPTPREDGGGVRLLFTKQLVLFAQEADVALTLAPYDAEIMATLACMLSQVAETCCMGRCTCGKKQTRSTPLPSSGWYPLYRLYGGVSRGRLQARACSGEARIKSRACSTRASRSFRSMASLGARRRRSCISKAACTNPERVGLYLRELVEAVGYSR